jgi:hypothetical protein
MKSAGKIIVQEQCGYAGSSMWVQRMQQEAKQTYKHVYSKGNHYYELVIDNRTYTPITKLGPPKEPQ